MQPCLAESHITGASEDDRFYWTNEMFCNMFLLTVLWFVLFAVFIQGVNDHTLILLYHSEKCLFLLYFLLPDLSSIYTTS